MPGQQKKGGGSRKIGRSARRGGHSKAVTVANKARRIERAMRRWPRYRAPGWLIRADGTVYPERTR